MLLYSNEVGTVITILRGFVILECLVNYMKPHYTERYQNCTDTELYFPEATGYIRLHLLCCKCIVYNPSCGYAVF